MKNLTGGALSDFVWARSDRPKSFITGASCAAEDRRIALDLCDGLIKAAHRRQVMSAPVMRRRVVLVRFYWALKLHPGA